MRTTAKQATLSFDEAPPGLPSELLCPEKEKSSQQAELEQIASAVEGLVNPRAYTGLYGFHKYWGKKPIEPLRFLVSALTDESDLVVDPFVGSGAIARESVQLGRRFLGGDVNPAAIRLTRFFANPCTAEEYSAALYELEQTLRSSIDSTYQVEPFGVASHLLWQGEQLLSVWERQKGKRVRKEREPTVGDWELSTSFESFTPKTLRPLRLFQNGRINSFANISWQTLFSGRALQNIDSLLTKIRQFPSPTRQALELTLTAAVGQMSRMVFAITSRGKTIGSAPGRVEVGSWVIGYWRPEMHFEVNVWNCFDSKARKVKKALNDDMPLRTLSSSFESVVGGQSLLSVEKQDALALLEGLPVSSVKLLITDPPHGDRIPYLELSEIWNAILDEESRYEDEIVVSNAKGRNKTPERYCSSLNEFFSLATDRLQSGGFLVLFFNSRRDDDWSSIRGITDDAEMNLLGCFPMEYSATSVVQDNREGGMKNDYILIYAKGSPSERALSVLRTVPGWKIGWPE
ncbi:MAG TPA: DNA methyltransferase [Candidatus Sulfotelmatobacter sp.]